MSPSSQLLASKVWPLSSSLLRSLPLLSQGLAHQGLLVLELGCDVPLLREQAAELNKVTSNLCLQPHPWGESLASWHSQAEHIHFPWQGSRGQPAAGPTCTRPRAAQLGITCTAHCLPDWTQAELTDLTLQLFCLALSRQPVWLLEMKVMAEENWLRGEPYRTIPPRLSVFSRLSVRDTVARSYEFIPLEWEGSLYICLGQWVR